MWTLFAQDFDQTCRQKLNARDCTQDMFVVNEQNSELGKLQKWGLGMAVELSQKGLSFCDQQIGKANLSVRPVETISGGLLNEIQYGVNLGRYQT